MDLCDGSDAQGRGLECGRGDKCRDSRGPEPAAGRFRSRSRWSGWCADGEDRRPPWWGTDHGHRVFRSDPSGHPIGQTRLIGSETPRARPEHVAGHGPPPIAVRWGGGRRRGGGAALAGVWASTSKCRSRGALDPTSVSGRASRTIQPRPTGRSLCRCRPAPVDHGPVDGRCERRASAHVSASPGSHTPTGSSRRLGRSLQCAILLAYWWCCRPRPRVRRRRPRPG